MKKGGGEGQGDACLVEQIQADFIKNIFRKEKWDLK